MAFAIFLWPSTLIYAVSSRIWSWIHQIETCEYSALYLLALYGKACSYESSAA